jgi:hypothetical protein
VSIDYYEYFLGRINHPFFSQFYIFSVSNYIFKTSPKTKN